MNKKKKLHNYEYVCSMESIPGSDENGKKWKKTDKWRDPFLG